MLVKVNREGDDIVVTPGIAVARPYKATTVCLADVTFEPDGIVGELVEAFDKPRNPGRVIGRYWERVTVSDNGYVLVRTGEPVAKTRGIYMVNDRVWICPDDTK